MSEKTDITVNVS